MSFDVAQAIAKLERRDNLRAAEQNAAWVIRRSKVKRIPSKNERETRVPDAMSCLHSVSYTMPCSKCHRNASEAKINLERLKAKLSIA